MARQNFASNNLNGGELSPRLKGRRDIDAYFKSVGRMKNALPLPFGGAQNTPGTVFVNEAKDSSRDGRLFDWVFGSQQAYILLFNGGKIRFYKDKGFVISTATSLTIESITKATAGVITITTHGLANNDAIFFNNVEGMSELTDQTFYVKNKTNDTFEISTIPGGTSVNTSAYGTFIAASKSKLLLHANATPLVDSSPNARTVTANGNVAYSTAQAKFGSGSIIFDASGDYLTCADHADWDFGTGDMTIDGWFYITDVTTPKTMAIWSQKNAAGSAQNRIIYNKDGGGTGLYWQINDGSSNLLTLEPYTAITANAWHHFAAVRSGNVFTLYLDGVSIATTTVSITQPNLTEPTRIGDFAGIMFFDGYIDEFRITKGLARFTGAFTPPTAQTEPTEALQIVYEVSHIYEDDELFEIQTAQAADIMYLAQGDHPTQKLSRFGDASWTIANVVFIDGPYMDENPTTTTLDPDDVTGNVTITASAITGINPTSAAPAGAGFQSTDVGRLIGFHDGTNWGWLKITVVTDTTHVDADVVGLSGVVGTNLGGHTATKRWRLGAFSATTGYPRAVAFSDGRLFFGGTNSEPQKIWGSVSGEFENFSPGSADDADAVSRNLNSNKVNIIKWLASTKRLIAGTEGENFTIYSGVSTEPITPTNIKADPETNYGSSSVTPVKIGSYLYYVQDDDQTLREFSFDFGIDGYRSINRSILAEHITDEGIVQMAYQKAPFGVIYAILEDGRMATFTREIEQEVAGWADQDPTATRPSDKYKSVASIPVNGYNENWFLVERVINGSTKKYVEYQVDPNQHRDADLEDMILMQSALTYDGSPSSTITGIDHLEGAAVAVLADGLPITGKTVSSGQITLTTPASVVQVGLPITSQIKLLPLEAGSSIGSAAGLMKVVSDVIVTVFRSLGLKVGKDGGNMEELFRDGVGVVKTTLQTDDFAVPSTMGWDSKQEFLFEQTKPLPYTILSVNLFEFTSEEGAKKNA